MTRADFTLEALATAIESDAGMQWERPQSAGLGDYQSYIDGGDYGIYAGPSSDSRDDGAAVFVVVHAEDGTEVSPDATHYSASDAVAHAERLQDGE